MFLNLQVSLPDPVDVIYGQSSTADTRVPQTEWLHQVTSELNIIMDPTKTLSEAVAMATNER